MMEVDESVWPWSKMDPLFNDGPRREDTGRCDCISFAIGRGRADVHDALRRERNMSPAYDSVSCRKQTLATISFCTRH
jgi:hypothetical protein